MNSKAALVKVKERGGLAENMAQSKKRRSSCGL
jgi:hypothetical protein